MHPADIQAAIKKAGSSQTELGAQLDVTQQAVNRCVHGHIRSRRIAARISAITGIPIDELWPGAYPSREHAA